MDEQNTGGAVWRPITLTDKATGRKVSISIIDREFYLSGLFTFEDLWEIYETPSDDAEVEGDENVYELPMD
jgi:hypothetical protein